MTWAFRSIGTMGSAFAANMTPGAPPGFQAGDLLRVTAVCVPGSITIPDLTSQGFTRLSLNSTISYVCIYGRIAQSASDAMPTMNMTGDWQACFCDAWTGAPASITGIIDTVGAAMGIERAINATSGVSFGGYSAPSTAGDLVCGAAVRAQGSANGVSFGSSGIYNTRATWVVNSRPHFLLIDLVQGAPASSGIVNVSTSPADSSPLTAGSELVFLKAGVAASPTFNQDDSLSTAMHLKRGPVHEFWQIPVELRSIVPPTPIMAGTTAPDFLPRIRSNVLAGLEQGIPPPLVGKDQVLTPTDWQYGWDPPQLPVSLRSDNTPLTANEMTQLTNFTPYTEYNWPVPMSVRQWQRSYEFSFNLNLLGQDQVLNTGPANLSWDPPAGRQFPISLRGMEQGGLSLFFFIPPRPPISEANQPIPLRARQPVQDFVQGSPQTIIGLLTTFPPFAPSVDLPPRGRSPNSALRGYEYSVSALLRGQDVVPFGLRYDERQIRVAYNASLYSITAASQFLIPVTPPPPPIGPGVRHMGRAILDPARVGESVIVPMDFISGLANGEVLVAGTATATLYSGTDTNPQAIVTGSMSFAGSIAMQQITPTIVGNIYTLIYKVVTSLGNVLELAGYFAVEPDLP